MFLMSQKQNRTLPGGRLRSISLFVFGAFVFTFAGATRSNVLAATAGSVDTSFGAAGKIIGQFPNTPTSAGVAVQPDGKLLVSGGRPGFMVVRYTRDGQLDTAFGNNGVASVLLGAADHIAGPIIIQPDGKIVVAGRSSPSNVDHGITLVRFTSAGVLDPTFGGDGVASLELSGSESYVGGLALQPSGALVVTGFTSGDSLVTTDGIVVRFTSSGLPDSTFGVNGVIREHTTAKSSLGAIVIGADGKILVGGTSYVGPFAPGLDDYDFLLYRYNADGTRDNTFGTNGRVLLSIGGGTDEIRALALQTDGKIIAAGRVLSDNFDLAIVRLTSAGALDAGNFGSGGKVLVNVADDAANAVAVDPDGYIVAAGGASNFILLVRCEPDGDLDPNFGTNGVARHNLTGESSTVGGMVLQPNLLHGVVNGYRIVTSGPLGFNNKFTAVRFRARSGPIQRAVVNDFDDDGISELALFRPTLGNWIIGKVPPTGTVTQVTTIHWGALGDKVVPGDYDGDGKYDLAVYRGGIWHILTSGGKYLVYNFGLSSDIPVPADYDGDSKTDVAVFRPSNGVWYWIRSSDQTFTAGQWGTNGDIPVVGDYDRDDQADLAVFRGGVWYILQSGSNQMRVEYFGLATDKPVAFDFDLDGKIDIGVFRAGDWYYIASDNGALKFYHWGQSSDIPIPGRYGTATGIAYNHGGQWWLLDRDIVWVTGPDGDIPVPTYFAQ